MNTKHQKILCPVDLSDRSASAVWLATRLAREQEARIVFLYVAPQWMPEESMMGGGYMGAADSEDEAALKKIRPEDPRVEYEHQFVHGNAGPEIIKASRSCDMIVMSTHGHGGLLRMLMGSVAQYTMRNAACPVIVVRDPGTDSQRPATDAKRSPYVTSVMHQIQPIQKFDNLADVMADLERARETGAPVADVTGRCIGILTRTDLEKYQELKARFAAGDRSVVDEMFEVDEYGMFRTSNHDFDQVQRHMTSPAITISDGETCETALEMFHTHPSIHHLVVVNDAHHPVGILERSEIEKAHLAAEKKDGGQSSKPESSP